jgi:hypothetical protein
MEIPSKLIKDQVLHKILVGRAWQSDFLQLSAQVKKSDNTGIFWEQRFHHPRYFQKLIFSRPPAFLGRQYVGKIAKPPSQF